MEKEIIKNKLRESLFNLISEEKKETEKEIEKKMNAEYAEIVNSLQGLGAPSQADIMQLAGLGKKGDKTAESLFSKKLYRKKNKDTGSLYVFDEKERASVIKAINTAKK